MSNFITSKGRQPLGIVRKTAIALTAAGALLAAVGQAGAQSLAAGIERSRRGGQGTRKDHEVHG